MRKETICSFFIFTIVALCIVCSQSVAGQFDSFLNSLKQAAGQSSTLSTDEMVSGLKEALEVGTGKAVAVLEKPGGYSLNPQVKIPLPESVEKIKGVLQAVGYGPQLEAFDKSMNTAAEAAAPKAKAIFLDSIKKMSISDAGKIIKGSDTAATDYLREKSSTSLTEVFRPIIHDSMSQVGTTSKYQALTQQIQSLPFTKGLNLDLDDYVTDGALKGLFFMLGQEEMKIRQDPAARSTELLKKVFGSAS